MKMNMFLPLMLVICSNIATAGEYPIVINNASVDHEPDDAESLGEKVYFLYRNQLIDLRKTDVIIPNPKQVTANDFCEVQTHSYTYYNHSPRNFMVGEYAPATSTFVWDKSKFLNPFIRDMSAYNISLGGDPDQQFNGDPDDDESVNSFFGVGNIRAVEIYPPPMNPKNSMSIAIRRELWEGQKQYYYQLDPPLEVEYVKDAELSAIMRELKIKKNAQDERTVQGYFEIGGAIVCGRREDDVLTLYRLSCWQCTLNTPIKVFEPSEKLVWDNEKSDKANLNAFKNLRKDLLEHNAGLTENRLYVRMMNYKVKLDKPGDTKALRDWYLLAPFYDPLTKTYRDTLEKSDFVSNTNDGFDPNSEGFSPKKFLKKMVPYTLPSDYWGE